MKNVKLVLALCVLAFPCTIARFTSLTELKSYAASVPEFPESESDDLERPRFKTLYTSLAPHWWGKTLMRLGLKRRPAWHPANITELISLVSDQPKKLLLTAPRGTHIITFGSLYGAFHSLARALVDLQQRNIIANNFVLKRPDTYLVFLGNTIDFSAYSLETLSVILTLMVANPKQVIYLAGHHESKKTWHNYGLKTELELRGAESLTAPLDTFFNRLPQHLTVTLQESGEQVIFDAKIPEDDQSPVLITGDSALKNYRKGRGLYMKRPTPDQIHWQLASSPVKLYRMLYHFFYDAYTDITLNKNLETSTITLHYSTGTVPFAHGSEYNLKTGSLITRGVILPAVTTADPMPLRLDQISEGIETVTEHLKTLDNQVQVIKEQLPDTILTPVPAVQTPLQKKLKKGVPLSESELQQVAFEVELLYNSLTQDVERLVKQADKKGLLTKLPAPPKKRTDTITLGSSLDVSKSVKGLGIPFRSGMALKVNKQNREGGINGKRVQIIFLDDGYIPSIARKNIETLLTTYNTPFILSPVGSPTLLASMDLIRDKKILVLFPQSGSLTFRKPDLDHIINVRASFNDEGRLLTDYVLENFLPKNFVFFYQDDEFGISILKGAQQALKKAGVTPGTEVSYLANTTHFKPAAEKIRQANPDAIGFFATGPATLQLIRDLGVEFLANKILYAVSSVGDAATVKVLKDRGLTVILGQVVPDPETSTLPIVEEYKNELKKQGLKENVFSLETYITTSITFDAMSKIKGLITMQKLIDQFEGMKNYEYKGLLLNFDPEKRSLAHYMWINTGEGPWIEKEIRTTEEGNEKN